MRALKTILIILLALLALLTVLWATGDPTYRVERSTVIQAPVAMAYGNVASLARMSEWGPWKDEETNMRTTYEGTDGQVGAVSKWTSDQSQGMQEITALEQDRSVRTKLTFIEPWSNIATGTFDLEALGDSTKVTWGIEGTNNAFGRMLGVFMDMDKMVGPMFEKGLANLKGLTEQQQQAVAEETRMRTFNGFTITTLDRPAMVYVGKRAVVKWADLEKFFGTQFGAAAAAAGKAGVQLAGAPTAVYFKWDEVKKQADLLAGFPVKGDPEVSVAGFETLAVPASKMLFIPYYGAYEGVGPAHEAMDAMIKTNGLTHYGNVFEEYVTDPTQEPDTAKWLTNVYYMVK